MKADYIATEKAGQQAGNSPRNLSGKASRRS